MWTSFRGAGQFYQLDNASKNLPVILVEEFSLTGGSREALRRIAENHGLYVMCHFSLVNFNLRKSLSYDKPCYSLYEFQMVMDKELV